MQETTEKTTQEIFCTDEEFAKDQETILKEILKEARLAVDSEHPYGTDDKETSAKTVVVIEQDEDIVNEDEHVHYQTFREDFEQNNVTEELIDNIIDNENISRNEIMIISDDVVQENVVQEVTENVVKEFLYIEENDVENVTVIDETVDVVNYVSFGFG